MCVKCKLATLMNSSNSSLKSTLPHTCKYSLAELTALLSVTTGLDRAFVNSAINVNTSIGCNSFNTKIDEIILKNP